jgi:hypothetical protein
MTWLSRALIALAIASGIVTPAFAGPIELSPMIGYRLGGGVTDFATGIEFDIKDNWSYGGTIDFNMPGGRFAEVLYSHQPTELKARSPYSGVFESADIDVDYWQLGVGQSSHANEKVAAYGIGTLGLTHFSAFDDGTDKFSIGFGGGAKFLPQKRVGLRLDARGYLSFVGESTAFVGVGPGGGTVTFSSNTLFQADLTAALTFRFGQE